MEEMICPLLSVASDYGYISCKGGNCAWWDCLNSACCLVSMADYTRDVSDSLERLTAEKGDADNE
mgnify:CR=1 FL=1